MPNKLTDDLSNNSPMLSNGLSNAEVKKALEWCEQFINNLVIANIDTKKRTLGLQAMQTCKSALGLINRQEEDKQNLKAEVERLKNTLDDVLDREPLLVERSEKYAKAEAYKEFAERLKESKYQSSDWSHGEHPYVVEESDIDNLLNELVGDGDGK